MGMNTFTTKQVACILGCTRQQVVNMIDAGRLQATRHGSVYIITQKALDNIKAPRKTGPKIKMAS